MMSQNNANSGHLLAALQWHIDHGADEALLETPTDRTKLPDTPTKMVEKAVQDAPQAQISSVRAPQPLQFQDNTPQEDIMGAAKAIEEAVKIAAGCQTLEELKAAIVDFDGLSVKKTASNMVFADGNPNSNVMLIGEAPGADEDIQGKPFVGVSGQLLDRILACINLDRQADSPDQSVYISNILNWRPPGNRTPTSAEMNISLPFIERHIALAKPKALILCGGVTAKTLLKSSDTISKLRGSFHDYAVEKDQIIPAMVTYHPAYLLRTPAQKRAVWQDMLMFQDKLKEL